MRRIFCFLLISLGWQSKRLVCSQDAHNNEQEQSDIKNKHRESHKERLKQLMEAARKVWCKRIQQQANEITEPEKQEDEEADEERKAAQAAFQKVHKQVESFLQERCKSHSKKQNED